MRARQGFRRREAREAARQCRRRRLRRPTCATRPSISSRPNTTIRWSCSHRRRSGSGGKLMVYDKTQGVQNVQRYLCGVFGMKPDEVSVMSPYMGGGFGAGLRPQYQVVLAVLGGARAEASGARRADARADVRARLPPGDHRASRARRQGRRHARRHHARGDRRDLAVRGILPQRYRLGGPALQKPQHEIRAQAGAAGRADFLRHARAGRRDGRLCAGMRDGRTRCRAQDRSGASCGCDAIPTATRIQACPIPASSCANATGRARRRSAGTSATPSRARCATAANWSAGAWRPASGRRCRCRPRSASC